MKKLWKEVARSYSQDFTAKKDLTKYILKNEKKTETKSCPKVLPLLKENEDEEEKQIKEDLAKEKVKAELKFMEVRYKRHQNKITSTDTEIINHILQITCEDLEESLLQW